MKKITLLLAAIFCLLSSPAAHAWVAGKTFVTIASTMAINVISLKTDGALEFTEFTKSADGRLAALKCVGSWTEANGLIETVVTCPDTRVGSEGIDYNQSVAIGNATEEELKSGRMLMAKSSLFGDSYFPMPFLVAASDIKWNEENLIDAAMILTEVSIAYHPHEQPLFNPDTADASEDDSN